MDFVGISKLNFFEPRRNQHNFEERSRETNEKVSQLARSTLETVRKQITLTNALLGICVTVHAASLLYPDVRYRWIENGSFDLPKILEGEVWRLVTSQVLHQSPLHLASNMYGLYHWGGEFEKKWGARGFAAMAAMAIGAKALASSLLSFKGASIGLSGVLYGLNGALVVSEFKTGSKAKESLKSVVEFTVSEYLFGQAMGLVGVNTGTIAHISGFVSGLLFGQFVPPDKVVQNEALVVTQPEPTRSGRSLEALPSTELLQPVQ